MQGPKFKIGKTDVIDSEGNRVVTETTKKKTADGGSIWTVKKQVDYDNDGHFDESTTRTCTYDKTGKLLEETSRDDDFGFISKIKYLYETGTGKLVKEIETLDTDGDGKDDEKIVTKYTSSGYEKTIDRNNDGIVDARKTRSVETYPNGSIAIERTEFDENNDRVTDRVEELHRDEKGRVTYMAGRCYYGDDLRAGNCVEKTEYDDKKGVATREIITYDENGSMMEHKKIIYRIHGDISDSLVSDEDIITVDELPIDKPDETSQNKGKKAKIKKFLKKAGESTALLAATIACPALGIVAAAQQIGKVSAKSAKKSGQ